MVSSTPEYLVNEVRREYGIEVSLETAITYLDADPYLTPETLYMYVTDYSDDETIPKGDEVAIPQGFTVVDLSKQETFDIPLGSGNYIWLLKDSCEFPQPEGMLMPVFNRVKIKGVSYRVMYTGKASSLYKRLWESHLNGTIKNSTLRKTLAALMGFPFEHYVSGHTPKVRISAQEESQITKWLYDNCILLFKTYIDIEKTERKLINTLDPPLNIDMNPKHHNGMYVAQLSKLRKEGGKKGKSRQSLFNRLFVGRAFVGTVFEEDKVIIWCCVIMFFVLAYCCVKFR